MNIYLNSTNAARRLFVAGLTLVFCVFTAQTSADDSNTGGAKALSDSELRRGRILFLQCRACHALSPANNEGKIGPSLAGVFTRSAGSADYYATYSSALKEAGHDWNSETMRTWLTAPSRMVPGTSMVFAGIADEAQRDLLVRYLQVVTQPTK